MAVIVSFLLISILTVAAITGQLALYMAVFLFVAFKNLRHYIRERRKEKKSKQTTHHCVSCMDYHKILKSQSHLWNYYITTKRANRDLREEIRKLTKQLKDKDLALEQITKKYTSLKREVHVKDEKLKYGKQQRNQLEEELTNKVTSLEETLNKKEQALKTAIEHVISDLDDLCTIHNDSLEQSVDETSNLNHETCHLPSPTESGVCLPTPKEEEEENDITDLSDGRFHFVSVLIDCCHYIKSKQQGLFIVVIDKSL
ncbi:PREDICTED: uncharacterized protein LOC109586703 [Amphimedon queenslandica]|uniref:Uncharacterized protein n=1 Tax=Amphimedon queenslandica TaxID=400682 RepID=A0AAN0JN80_AMPQE|nr:PREDICTED: uncharacterized protein LOC109586703 [Amphimedon queenslandica]|eukprot:XP_019858469.1 PREDICTED: uncharacterized protein LOC109586703 [Amphimedon queenslandica]